MLVTTGVLGVLVALLGPGAFGYWVATGSGAGGAPTTSSQRLVLTPGTPSTSVHPGGSADVAVRISNGNGHQVRVSSLALSTTEGTGGFAVDAGHASCDLSTLSFTAQDNGSAGWTVPARSGGADGTLDLSLTGALSMSSSAADACQGATFQVYLRVVA